MQHFIGIAEIHLRRGTAVRLCQLAAGSSIKQAAQRLGLPETWRLIDQLRPPAWLHGRPPPLGDRKRQSTSIYVWARVTGRSLLVLHKFGNATR